MKCCKTVCSSCRSQLLLFKISQYSQENICAGVSFLKNSFFYRKLPVAAFMSIRKEKEEESVEQKEEKFFKWKKKKWKHFI